MRKIKTFVCVLLLAILTVTTLTACDLVDDASYHLIKDYECFPVMSFSDTSKVINPTSGIIMAPSSNGGFTAAVGTSFADTVENDYHVVFTVNDVGFILTTKQYDVYLLLCNMESFTITEKVSDFGADYFYNDNHLDIKKITDEELQTYIKISENKEDYEGK